MGNQLGALCLNGFALVNCLLQNYFDSLNCGLSSKIGRGLRVKCQHILAMQIDLL